MSELEDRALLVVLEGRYDPKIAVQSEPKIAIQNVTRNVVLCNAPLERFSNETPVIPYEADKDLKPIDVLYGSYDYKSRTIEIYIKNIERDASLFGEFDDFLEIVRLHEYVHAIVHLGVYLKEVTPTLSNLNGSGRTDWKAFHQKRTRSYKKIDSSSHEYLAQAVTLAAISQHPDSHHAQRLRATFEKLERLQPPHYFVEEDIKALVAEANWPLVIAAARGDDEALPTEGYALRDALLALTRASAPPQNKG